MANADKTKIYNYFLFSGYFDDQKQLVSKATPIVNTALIVQDVSSVDYINTEPVVLKTNENGKIQGIHNKDFTVTRAYTRAFSGDSNSQGSLMVTFPPVEALSYIALQKMEEGKDWGEEFLKVMKNFPKKDSSQAEIIPTWLALDQITPPASNPVSTEEKSYAKCYKGIEKHLKDNDLKKIPAYIFPKVKGVFLTFSTSSAIDLLKVVELKKPNSSVAEDIPAADFIGTDRGEFHIALRTGTEQQYPNGMYELKVVFDQKPGESNKWSGNVIGHEASGKKTPDTYSYTLSVMARFDHKVTGGEFSLIQCDPISIEETLITQFPNQYAHIVQAALDFKQTADVSAIQTSANVDSIGMQSFIKNLGLVKSWGDLANGIGDLESRSAAGWFLSKALHDKLSQDENTVARHILDGTFAWKGFHGNMIGGPKKFQDAMDKAKAFHASNQGRLVTASLKDWAKNAFTNLDVEDFDKKYAAKIMPEAVYKRFGKALAIVDLAVNTLAVVDSSYALARAAGANTDAKSNYKSVVDSYMELTGYESSEQVELKVQFALDSDVIIAGDDNLEKFATILANNEDVKSIVIEGYTCTLGEEEYNLDLSLRRAEAVKTKLESFNVDGGRLTCKGHGIKFPTADNDTNEGREKNRRVISSYKITTHRGAPCREGIQSCERHRMMTVNSELAEYDGVVNVMCSVFDLAVGIAACFPLTAPAALAIIAVKDGTAVLKNAASAFDKSVLDGVYTDDLNERSRVMQLRHESHASGVLIRDLTKGDYFNRTIPAANIAQLQYRVRAEAVNGLLQLMIRAVASSSDKDSDKTLEQMLDDYKVEAYIENFILNDQWVYPLRTRSSFTMDEMWLFTVNAFNWSVFDDDDNATPDPELRSGFGVGEMFKLLKPSELAKNIHMDSLGARIAAIAIDGKKAIRKELLEVTHVMSNLNPTMPNDIKADFHNEFPVHAMNTENLTQFARDFQIEWPDLDEDMFHHTEIFVSRNDSEDTWFPLRRTIADADHPLASMRTLTPYSKMKIVIIFDKEKVKGYIPVNCQLYRVDGIVNAQGPKYKSVARPIKEKEFDDLKTFSNLDGKNFKDYYGCVIHPFFQFGSETICGLKPMIPANWAWGGLRHSNLAKYAAANGFEDMRYGFKVSVGKSDRSFWLPIGPKSELGGSLDEFPDEFPVNLRVTKNQKSKRFGEAKFLVEKFLRSNAISDNPDPLFENRDCGISDVLIRVGGENNPWVSTSTAFKDQVETRYGYSYGEASSIGKAPRILNLDGFDWNSSVEFAFVFYGMQPKLDAYNKKKKSYDKFGASVTLEENRDLFDVNNDTEGPSFNNLSFELYSVGTKRKHDQAELDKHTTKKNHAHTESLKDIISMIESDDESLALKKTAFLHSGKVSTGGQGNGRFVQREVWTYIAYKKMSYVNFNGKKIHSIRPFGNGKVVDDSKGTNEDPYFCYRFKNMSSLVGGLSNENLIPQFNFESPKAFLDPKEPWWTKKAATSSEEKDKFTTPNMKAVDKWLEDHSTLLGQLDPEIEAAVGAHESIEKNK